MNTTYELGGFPELTAELSKLSITDLESVQIVPAIPFLQGSQASDPPSTQRDPLLQTIKDDEATLECVSCSSADESSAPSPMQQTGSFDRDIKASTAFRQPPPEKLQNSLDAIKPSLITLPSEIIHQIASHAGPAEIFVLRQVSTRFAAVVQKRALNFNWVDGTAHVAVQWMNFTQYWMNEQERNVLRMILARDLFCKQCYSHFSSGRLGNEIYRLCNQMIYCDGCRCNHPKLFFGEDQLRRAEKLCVGRIGSMTICSHSGSPEPLQWGKLEQHVDETDEGVKRPYRHLKSLDYYCSDPSHQPYRQPNHKSWGSAYPRIAIRAFNGHSEPSMNITYGWDIPILEIGTKNCPNTQQVQQQLCRMIAEKQLLQGQKLCTHIRADLEIVNLIQRSICDCFIRNPSSRKDQTIYAFCNCERDDGRLHHVCRECAAAYCFYNVDGCIYLSSRNTWRIAQPVSPKWLGLLDRQSIASLSDEARKHKLWCDDTNCATAKGRRWFRLVKRHSGVYTDQAAETAKIKLDPPEGLWPLSTAEASQELDPEGENLGRVFRFDNVQMFRRSGSFGDYEFHEIHGLPLELFWQNTGWEGEKKAEQRTAAYKRSLRGFVLTRSVEIPSIAFRVLSSRRQAVAVGPIVLSKRQRSWLVI